MFSGKSTEMKRQCERLQAIGKRVMYVSPKGDVRSATSIVLHSKSSHDVPCRKVGSLAEISETDIESMDAFGVDELQFFEGKDVLAFIEVLRAKKRHGVFASLLADSQRVMWGTFALAAPFMDHIIFVRSMCVRCNDGTEAAFTQRISNNTERVHVGGIESYIPTCHVHYC